MNRRFMMLLSVVVVVGLGLGAFIASITTPTGPVIQSVAFAQGGANSGQGQGGANRTGSGGANQGSTNGQSAGQTQGQGAAPLFGSVTSVDGNTLTVNTQQGDKKVNLSSAKLQKTVDGTTDDLKAGESVVVTGQQGSDGVLAATSIQIRPDGSSAGGQGMMGGQGGQRQGQRQAQGQGQAQGQSQGQGQGQGQSQGTRPVAGTISSVSGDAATITTQQGDVKVNISGAKIQKTVDATASDLKSGERVVVAGQQAQDGSYTATNVQIVPDSAQTGRNSAGQPAQGNGTSSGQPAQGGNGGSTQ